MTSTPSRIPEKVRRVLEQHGLDAREFEPGSTPTSPLAAEQLGVEVGQIAKSILLKAKDGRFYLVVAAGDRRIDNKRLKEQIGVKARMATAEETEQVTGFRPGGVCPFGLADAENLTVWVDRSLDRYDTVYPAAGTDASGVPMTPEQLIQVTGSERCDVMAAPL
jgi:prolyl-tRNA editing enzyme YbaK/EbsC (Cys-tRNA(Pro) deacylase)